MANEQDLEKDIREFLGKFYTLHGEDRIHYLMAVFKKHFEISNLSHNVTYNDLFNIVSTSKSNFVNQSSHLYVSGKALEKSELTQVAMMESVVSYLNMHNLLKKRVRIDYTDSAPNSDGLDY